MPPPLDVSGVLLLPYLDSGRRRGQTDFCLLVAVRLQPRLGCLTHNIAIALLLANPEACATGFYIHLNALSALGIQNEILTSFQVLNHLLESQAATL